ncbi:MAG: hypothetical protein ACYCT1_08410 [Steroidobacteraceae bacterium]
MRANWEPSQGFPASPSTDSAVVGYLNQGTGAESVLSYTPPAAAGLVVRAALVVSQACNVSVWLAWVDLKGNNRQSVLLPETYLDVDGWPLAPVTIAQQAGSAATLWIQASVDGACSTTASIEELI